MWDLLTHCIACEGVGPAAYRADKVPTLQDISRQMWVCVGVLHGALLQQIFSD